MGFSGKMQVEVWKGTLTWIEHRADGILYRWAAVYCSWIQTQAIGQWPPTTQGNPAFLYFIQLGGGNGALIMGEGAKDSVVKGNWEIFKDYLDPHGRGHEYCCWVTQETKSKNQFLLKLHGHSNDSEVGWKRKVGEQVPWSDETFNRKYGPRKWFRSA